MRTVCADPFDCHKELIRRNVEPPQILRNWVKDERLQKGIFLCCSAGSSLGGSLKVIRRLKTWMELEAYHQVRPNSHLLQKHQPHYRWLASSGMRNL